MSRHFIEALNVLFRILLAGCGADPPELPATYQTDKLESWTGQGKEAERFAGTARYRLTFDVQKLQVQRDAWGLDLGRVASSAWVRLNGREPERAFSGPFAAFWGLYGWSDQENIIFKTIHSNRNGRQ